MRIPLGPLMKEHVKTPVTLIWILALTFVVGYISTQYAHSADVEAAKRELRLEISKVNTKVASNGKKIDRILVLQYSEAIRGQYRQICSTTDAMVKMTLQSTLDSLQADYMDITDGFYPLGGCHGS